MGVSLLIISHRQVGSALLNAVKQALGGDLPLPVTTVEIEPNADPDILVPRLRNVVRSLNRCGGVLILTDLFGSTPSNIARHLQSGPQVRVVTGLNLPMLIRVMNYPQLDLNSLSEKACTGGRCGIIECEQMDEGH